MSMTVIPAAPSSAVERSKHRCEKRDDRRKAYGLGEPADDRGCSRGELRAESALEESSSSSPSLDVLPRFMPSVIVCRVLNTKCLDGGSKTGAGGDGGGMLCFEEGGIVDSCGCCAPAAGWG
mmetsp:Transcript_26110/g.57204  ORF Transcript_26110/g.57204 Transcript_26110/m.57204 type:complete len:122 (-) Transcript_26110:62-427(-)